MFIEGDELLVIDIPFYFYSLSRMTLDVSYRRTSINTIYLFFFVPFIILALPSNSLLVVTQIQGHIAGPFPPLPTTVCAFVFNAGIIHHFLPLSTHVELCLPTLLGALSSCSSFFFFHFCKQIENLTTVAIELKDQRTHDY